MAGLHAPDFAEIGAKPEGQVTGSAPGKEQAAHQHNQCDPFFIIHDHSVLFIRVWPQELNNTPTPPPQKSPLRERAFRLPNLVGSISEAPYGLSRPDAQLHH